MKIIYNPSQDPYFNLAAEEYLLRRAEGDIFMLWRNDRSVIIGKNQNARAEVNITAAEQAGAKIARRITGGGAVFHDLGNINFSFISKISGSGAITDFADFAAPILKALASFGVNAAAGGRNDILADGAKISGCAACVLPADGGQRATLRHGTLLFDTDVNEMAKLLTVNRLKMQSKGIASVKSRVANIKSLPLYRGPASADDFLGALIRFAEGEFGVGASDLTQEETESIRKLRDEKFASWEWIWGMAPAFSDIREERFPFGTVSVMVDCRGDIIDKIRIYGDFFSEADISELEAALTGVPLRRDALAQALSTAPCDVGDYISGCDSETLQRLILRDGER